MIDIATLKEYIKVLEESSLQALELSDGADSIRMSFPWAVPIAAVLLTAGFFLAMDCTDDSGCPMHGGVVLPPYILKRDVQMKLLFASDSFKGSLTSEETAALLE